MVATVTIQLSKTVASVAKAANADLLQSANAMTEFTSSMITSMEHLAPKAEAVSTLLSSVASGISRAVDTMEKTTTRLHSRERSNWWDRIFRR